MSQIISDLTHEHDAILAALRILERMAERAQRNQLAPGDLAEFLGFLREFVDQCHHGKEEGLLFPAMARAGLAEHGGFIDELLAEHVQGRALIQAMAQAGTPTINAAEFASAATAYAEHLRAHIAKENDTFFPMAERLLDTPTMEALHQAFAEHEAKVIGAGRHEQLHQLLHQLKAKYLG
ncbi:MAG: hemerythrin domain-containing protein [Pseudomonas sagittaria]|nr:hemerythrin domain-containing protein [Pseudomonas sagittaria]